MANPWIASHMPNSDEWIHLDRQWICDVIYSLSKNEFQALINEKIVARRQQVKEKQKTLVGIRSEFIDALKRSVVFSSKYAGGVSTHPPCRHAYLLYRGQGSSSAHAGQGAVQEEIAGRV